MKCEANENADDEILHTEYQQQLQAFDCNKANLEQYHCKICDINFDTVVNLKTHVREQSLEERQEKYGSRSYICKNCPFETYSSLHWIKHVTDECLKIDYSMLHRTTSLKFFECAKCTYKARKMTIKSHFLSEHVCDEEKNWFKYEKCAFSKCAYKATERNDLKIHFILKHCGKNKKKNSKLTTTQSKKFKCDLKTKFKRNLNKPCIVNHIKNEDKNWLNCEKCTFKTIDKLALTRHSINKHSNDEDNKWFKCEKCGFKTIYKSALYQHFVAKHVNDEDKNWVKCEKCTFRTIHKSNLSRHINRKHSGGMDKEEVLVEN